MVCVLSWKKTGHFAFVVGLSFFSMFMNAVPSIDFSDWSNANVRLAEHL